MKGGRIGGRRTGAGLCKEWDPAEGTGFHASMWGRRHMTESCRYEPKVRTQSTDAYLFVLAAPLTMSPLCWRKRREGLTVNLRTWKRNAVGLLGIVRHPEIENPQMTLCYKTSKLGAPDVRSALPLGVAGPQEVTPENLRHGRTALRRGLALSDHCPDVSGLHGSAGRWCAGLRRCDLSQSSCI